MQTIAPIGVACAVKEGLQGYTQRHDYALQTMQEIPYSHWREYDPEDTVRFLVDKGFTQRYDYALQTLKEIPYGKWAEYNPEDTVRFYALRLYEAGMIKSSPQKLIAEGTDWHFLNELKREMKG